MKDKRQYRVLLVENDDEDYMIIAHWLKQAKWLDFAIDWVTGYASAKRYLTRKRPDIILSNHKLSHNRTGLDLANWLWARNDNIPMLLMSGGDTDNNSGMERLHKVVVDFLPESKLSAELLELNISRVIHV